MTTTYTQLHESPSMSYVYSTITTRDRESKFRGVYTDRLTGLVDLTIGHDKLFRNTQFENNTRIMNNDCLIFENKLSILSVSIEVEELSATVQC